VNKNVEIKQMYCHLSASCPNQSIKSRASSTGL
jgi:hypothetical protein